MGCRKTRASHYMIILYAIQYELQKIVLLCAHENNIIIYIRYGQGNITIETIKSSSSKPAKKKTRGRRTRKTRKLFRF